MHTSIPDREYPFDTTMLGILRDDLLDEIVRVVLVEDLLTVAYSHMNKTSLKGLLRVIKRYSTGDQYRALLDSPEFEAVNVVLGKNVGR